MRYIREQLHQEDGKGLLREEAVNVLLAQVLKGRGLLARAERRTREGIPDIRLPLATGDLLLVECKWEGSAGLLRDQLDERLESFPEAVGVVGLLYPDVLRRMENTMGVLESTDGLQWWLHGSRGKAIPNSNIRSGSVGDLADYLRTLPLQLEGVDRVVAAAAAVGYAIEQASGRIGSHARISLRVADVIARTDQEKNRRAALRIGSLVVFNALAFQDRLCAVHEEVPTVKESISDGIPGLTRAWRYICDNIDYVPVFQLANEILEILSEGPDDVQMPVLDPLVKAVQDTRSLEGHDLSGRLFHTLLTDAKFTGAYYTSVPAATLLTRLVFDGWPPHVDWSDHEFPGSLNVADLACGTGTLLMSVAAEVQRRHADAGGRRGEELHKAMVEQAIHGYDVQLSAVHFAATTLAMLNPDIEFDHMNLYVMPLGAESGTVSLGSLDFLEGGEVAVQYSLSGDPSTPDGRGPERLSGRGLRGVGEGVTATLPTLDLAIMNPPFTRSVGGNLLFGSLPRTERRKLQNELSRRLKARRRGPGRRASATAGLGAAFVAAAVPNIRPRDGRLALVLPLTVCTGPSWQQTRSVIEQYFVLDTVIASHDPARWNFSDSTDLSEALLIATRRPAEGWANESRTTFVNLWRNPTGVLDAHRVASTITSTSPARLEDGGTALLKIDGQDVGEVLSMPETRLSGKKWSGIQFARADLIRSALRLLEEEQVWVPGEGSQSAVTLCGLRELGQVGPDRRDLWDGFQRTDSITAYPMVENHDTELRRRLVASPDKHLSPLAKPPTGRKLKSVSQLWPKAGRLLVAERLRLNTARIVAMRSEERVLSNVWWPVQIGDSIAEKVLVLWLNSSLGVLTILAHRTSTEGGWVAMKKADLQELPVIDTRNLSKTQLQAMANLFDELSDSEFQRLPAMSNCPARRSLDEGIAKILKLPDLATLRTLLSSEPVVSNRQL